MAILSKQTLEALSYLEDMVTTYVDIAKNFAELDNVGELYRSLESIDNVTNKSGEIILTMIKNDLNIFANEKKTEVITDAIR